MDGGQKPQLFAAKDHQTALAESGGALLMSNSGGSDFSSSGYSSMGSFAFDFCLSFPIIILGAIFSFFGINFKNGIKM